MADRKLSIDSQSSGTSNEHKRIKSNLVIKKRLLKKKAPPPFQILAASSLGAENNLEATTGGDQRDHLSRTQTNLSTSRNHQQNLLKIPQGSTAMDNSFMSFTDQSDSDSSIQDGGKFVFDPFENQSISSARGLHKTQFSNIKSKHQNPIYNNHSLNTSLISGSASIGGTPLLQLNSQRTMDDQYLSSSNPQPNNHQTYQNANSNQQHQQQNLNQAVEQKKMFHPFADKPSPFEEWKQVIILAMETMFQFMIWDVCGNLLKWSGKALAYIFVLTPLLILSMLGESLRRLKNKCKKSENNPFKRSKSRQQFFENESNDTKQGDFIIVVDLDLTLIYTTIFKPENDQDAIVINKSESSLPIYVYKRPYLDTFLKDLSKMGQISIFTAGTQEYADPIIDEIDPQGLIKGRYYREHCKLDKHGNQLKPMEIITKNLKKLVIIEDQKIIKEKYPKNTILVPEFTNNNKKDKALLQVLNVLEQLYQMNTKDVSADLNSVIEILDNLN
eukprot:403351246